jgi:DNA-directed RNA polymerase subunit RPC12/RpoP
MKCKKCGFDGFTKQRYLSSIDENVNFCSRCDTEVEFDRLPRIKGYCGSCKYSYIKGSNLRCPYRMFPIEADSYCDDFENRERVVEPSRED